MIGRIKGILLEKQLPTLLIDVGGLGYEVQVSMHSVFKLPGVGSEVVLYTHLVTREDSQTLYGFADKAERMLFLALIKISGIGPKSALGILSSVEPEEFVHSVMADDVNALVRLPGVGKKTAQRLIIEMRDRFANWEIEGVVSGFSAAGITASDVKVSAGEKSTVTRDALSALVVLGFSPIEARRVVLQNRRPDISSEELIRIALKELSK